jgi:uncharacterized protein YggU (UPF0235/DUF167 family)
MKIFVTAKPRAKIPSIKKLEGLFDEQKASPRFIVAVKEPPVDGRANYTIQKILAEYFKVSPSKIRLISGQSSRSKVFELGE